MQLKNEWRKENMKTIMTAVIGMMLLCGCKMKEFSSSPLYAGSEVKFTGAVEDRVNLWPLAYWREPVGSVAWPLISWGDDHLALRPLFSQYRQSGSGDYDEFNFFWPISQFDTKHSDYRVFPLFWGKSCNDNPYFCLFPALWWNREFAGVFPIFWDNDDVGSGFCVFPLFWSETTPSGGCWNTLWPLYYYESHPKSDKNYLSDTSEFWALAYLAGYNRRDGNFTDHRFLPFYAWDRGNFYSLPYSRCTDGGRIKSRVLCGLAGCDSNTNGEYQASWLLPLYCHDKESFVTPLFGKTGEADWVVPLYGRDKSTFVSLPYWRQLGSDGEIDRAFSLSLLSGYERDHKSGDRLLYLLMGLGGHVWNDETGGASWVFPLFYKDRESFYTLLYGRNPCRTWLFPVYFDGEERMYITPFYGRNKRDGSDWLIPLYYRDEDSFISPLYGKSGDADWLFPLYCRKAGQSFCSIPYGWSGGGSAYTNTYFAAGLAGLKSGRKEGSWMFPFFDYRKDADFGEKEAWLDEARLPECASNYVLASNAKTHLLVFDNDKSVYGQVPYGVTNRYEMTEWHKLGNRLVFNHESKRKVCFDTATRDKVSDSEEDDTSLLMLLYNGEYRSDRMKGTSYMSHRVLWKLWDWEEEDGDVALDVFPGFTYDSKKNGYSKTSLLWRFFRYENDPEKGKKLDLLFIPVWR